MAVNLHRLMITLAPLLLVSCLGEPREDAPRGGRLHEANEGFTDLLLRRVETTSPLAARLSPGPQLPLPRVPSGRLFAFAELDALKLFESHFEQRFRTRWSLDALHALGVVQVLGDTPGDAVASLELAVAGDATSADIWNDYAASLIERARTDDRPIDYLAALYALLKSLKLEPNHLPANFNLGLVLEHLGLKHVAVGSWRRYLDLDSSSSWASEARSRLSQNDLSTNESWEESRAEVERAILLGRLESAARLLMERSSTARKAVAETVLGEWARAQTENRLQEAEDRLAFAALVAVISDEQDGDRLLADSLVAIDQAKRSSRAELRRLALGHLKLSRGIALRRRGQYEPAGLMLAESDSLLEAGGDPLAGLAKLNRAICLSRTDNHAAVASLRHLGRQMEGKPYPWLRAQVEWMLGLTTAYAGEPWLAITHYEAALTLFIDSNDSAGTAGVGPLLAEGYDDLGFRDRSWTVLLRAIEALSRSGDSAGLDRALDLAVLNAANDGRIDAALMFQDEQTVHHDRVANGASSRVTFLTLRAGLLRKLGRFEEAYATLEDAQAHVDSLGDAALRRLLAAEIDAEKAMTLGASRPSQALASFRSAFAAFEKIGNRSRHLELLLARSEVYRAAGDLESAEQDLLDGLDEASRSREAASADIRIAAFEARQALFDSAIRFYLDARRDPGRALEIAERAKARELESRAGLEEEPRTVAGWQAELPSDAVLVEYAVLPDRLEIWAATQQELFHETVQITAVDLDHRISALRRALAVGDAEATAALSALLYDTLLRPVRAPLTARGTAIFVPDRFLALVPFAALTDRETGEPLVSTHRNYKAPSAHLLVGSMGTRRTHEIPRLLALGDPAFDRRLYPHLERLPAAEDEARELAPLYPFHEVITGTAATPRRFAEALPGANVLQIAAHTQPTPSGKTELVLAPDEAGASGLLDLDDLDPAALSELELAYLSACSGATAPTGDREGLRGPSRSLLAAGVPAVVASLWGVDDQMSRTLAKAFHRRFLEGQEPGSALRDAQRELRSAGVPTNHWAAYEVFLSAWPAPEKGE